jgi:hypothetical protein
VLDGQSPASALDYTEVTLEYSGDADGTAPMTWYGEFLWRGALPAPGSYSYRVCATDAAGNHACSNPKLSAGGGDITPGDDAGPPSPDAGNPIECNGHMCTGGCCSVGTSGRECLVPLSLVVLGLAGRRRRRCNRNVASRRPGLE